MNRPAKSPASLRNEFRQRISTDPAFRVAVLIELYDRQTPREQKRHQSLVRDGQGFTKPDAHTLTPLAEKVLRSEALTAEEHKDLVRLLPKYWRQFIVAQIVEIPTRSIPPKGSQFEDRRVA